MKKELVLTMMLLAWLPASVLAIDINDQCYTFDTTDPYLIVNNPCSCLDLSTPKVDGFLCDTEYDDGEPGQTGLYSELYAKYVSTEGLYICNDWYKPSSDPQDECDAMNQFDWTDTATSPDTFWRVIVHGNVEDFQDPSDAITVKYRENVSGSEWAEPPNLDAWEAYSGYHTSENDEYIEHFIWELLIPADIISGDIEIGLVDPKSTPPGDCPTTGSAYSGSGLAALSYYGSAPNIDMEDIACIDPPDITAPTPNPITWSTVPTAVTTTSITMAATAATDPSGVQYYFDCTAGGGNDSGWQDSRYYTDTGLSPNTQYTYRVVARDKSSYSNMTGYSIAKSASTDLSSPTPNPMTWASVPNAVSSTSITMTSTTATDVSGVEYYFECVAGGGNDSGWQSSSSYTDTGLSSNTQYTYRVRARDKSLNQNATTYSSTASATTL